MAIIECPECKQAVSDKAEHCVNCGCPIKPHKKQVQVVQKEGCFLRTLNVGCLVGVVFFVLIILNLIFSRF